MIRPMRPDDEPALRDLYAACHPGWPAQAADWYVQHRTLVLEVEGRIVGSTSYTVGPAPTPAVRDTFCYGRGVYVDPGARGQGYGRLLSEARARAGKALGAEVFLGMTQPGNVAMIRLFEKGGLKMYGSEGDYYPDGSSAFIYIGRLA